MTKVENNLKNFEGFVLGMIGGMINFFLKIDLHFLERLIESAIAALVTGAAGMLGHYLLSKFLNRNKKQ